MHPLRLRHLAIRTRNRTRVARLQTQRRHGRIRHETDRVTGPVVLLEDLLEIFDDRYDRKSTLITSQMPVNTWHAYIANPTFTDAILDRILHNSHRIELAGPSIRKEKASVIDEEEETRNCNVTLQTGGGNASVS